MALIETEIYATASEADTGDVRPGKWREWVEFGYPPVMADKRLPGLAWMEMATVESGSERMHPETRALSDAGRAALAADFCHELAALLGRVILSYVSRLGIESRSQRQSDDRLNSVNPKLCLWGRLGYDTRTQRCLD
jgi:hypothetical protein